MTIDEPLAVACNPAFSPVAFMPDESAEIPLFPVPTTAPIPKPNVVFVANIACVDTVPVKPGVRRTSKPILAPAAAPADSMSNKTPRCVFAPVLRVADTLRAS